MGDISTRLNRIKPSATMAITQRAGELRAAGVDVVSFSAGEPDFDTPRHIVEAAQQALDRGMTRYTPVAGIPELRGAIAEDSQASRGVPCSADQVIVTVGAKHALYGFFMAVIDPGDEVIIPAPHWVSYPDQALLAGGVPVIAKTDPEQGFLLTVEALEKAITPRSKVLVLNDPNNPTGAVHPPDRVGALVAAAVGAGLHVLSDEVYRALLYGDAAHTSPLSAVDPGLRRKVFVVDGVSKSFAMTGWRIGWGIGDPEIVKAIARLQGQSTSNPTAVSQAAALAALNGPRDFLPGWVDEYRRRRDAMVGALNRIDGVRCLCPDGAFYVLPSFRGVIERMGRGATDIDLAERLLDRARVACVPGTPFGAPGHLRFSYATSLDAIEKGLGRIAEAVAEITR